MDLCVANDVNTLCSRCSLSPARVNDAHIIYDSYNMRTYSLSFSTIFL